MGSERDYDWAIAQSNAHLADMQGHATDAEIDRVEIVNADLDEDHHRKTCSDTTSQFTNAVNIWLTAGSDPVAIIDRVRDALLAEGWTRSPSVEELESGTQDPEGRYTQNLDSPERFLAQLSKWEDDGTSGISFSIISPCVANPSDKPDTWGR